MPRERNKRDKHQENQYKINRAKIFAVLQKAPKGISRSELSKITKLKPTTICNHINDLKNEGLAREKKRLLYWKTCYEKVMIIESAIESLTSRLEKYDADKKNIGNGALFTQNIFIIIPSPVHNDKLQLTSGGCSHKQLDHSFYCPCRKPEVGWLGHYIRE
jgi:DNA-binding transcriptional ArsR family regulator